MAMFSLPDQIRFFACPDNIQLDFSVVWIAEKHIKFLTRFNQHMKAVSIVTPIGFLQMHLRLRSKLCLSDLWLEQYLCCDVGGSKTEINHKCYGQWDNCGPERRFKKPSYEKKKVLVLKWCLPLNFCIKAAMCKIDLWTRWHSEAPKQTDTHVNTPQCNHTHLKCLWKHYYFVPHVTLQRLNRNS